MRHDSSASFGLLYRWNDPLHRVEFWSHDEWIPSGDHETTVNIPFHNLVTYEDTWCEPCEGITEPGAIIG